MNILSQLMKTVPGTRPLDRLQKRELHQILGDWYWHDTMVNARTNLAWHKWEKATKEELLASGYIPVVADNDRG